MPPESLRIYAIELHVVGHCNIACVGCSQSSPRVAPRFEDVGRIERSLANLRGIIKCEKLQVLGGEPLLHPDIANLCRIAKASSVGERVTVKTNGIMLADASPEFWQSVDEVIVSVYPSTSRALARLRSGLERVAIETGTRLVFRDIAQFNHVIKQSPTSSDRFAQMVFERCEYKTFTPSLCEGRLYRCAPSVNLHRSGVPVASEVDSIDINARDENGGAIVEMLTSDRHLEACHWCLGSSGSAYPHTLGWE
jgi:GTP 3',8-cyclase